MNEPLTSKTSLAWRLAAYSIHKITCGIRYGEPAEEGTVAVLAPCTCGLQTLIEEARVPVEPVAPSSPPADPDPEPSRADKLRAALEPAGVKVTVLGEAAEPRAGLKCYHCNGAGKFQIYDHITGYDERSCDTCEGIGRITTIEQYLKTVPANWHENSSLETWFPITAEELKRLKDERVAAPPPAHPSAWIRGRVTPSGPHGPEEYDEEVCPGEDQPPGEGWVALYTYPHPYEKLRASTPPAACQHCETWKRALEATEANRKRLELRVDELEDRAAEPPSIALLNLKCRFGCTDPAVVLVEFDDGGCVCWPDKVQALCAQHWQTSEPIKGARAIASLAEPPPTARRIELLNLLEYRERKHDDFRLAEQSGKYAEELRSFDEAHCAVLDWVTDHADELLPLLRPAPPPAAPREG